MKCTTNLIILFLTLSFAEIWSIPFDERLYGDQLTYAADNSYNKAEITKFRLPSDLKPQHYDLHFIPDLEKAIFTGHAKITVKVESSTRYIVLNAKYIEIDSVIVTKINIKSKMVTETIEPSSKELDAINEQLTITLPKAIAKGNTYVVEIKYKGVLGDDMMGFYLSSYEIDGKTKFLASTQFESTGARRAFPSFDEPGFKTPFIIKITRNKTQKSISNLPIESTIPAGESSSKEIDTFKESPPMPTYLVGFIVFEFESISNKDGTFRVWGRENIVRKQGQYILDEGQKILTALSKYLGIDYFSVLPKMDLVAVPDFDAGAMENWGMTTYREKVLLVDLKETKTSIVQQATSVVTHEFSHQWFGDLVTPSWWDYTWLNEAFARYFEYFGTHLVEPLWRMEDLFVVEQVQVAFNSDLKNSHAITSNTTSPESIAATFDHIIYNKGGSVLRMIENVLTPPIFQKALQRHLKNGKDNLEGTVEPANLWDAFDEVLREQNALSKLPNEATTITDFIEEWINKPGFPLVSVSRNSTNINVSDSVTTLLDSNKTLSKINTIVLTQERFLTKASDQAEDNTKWNIPITYTYQSQATNDLKWLTKDKALEIAIPQKDWVIVNVNEIGFYRVNYDVENWKRIAAQLSEDQNQISILNRAQILDDAFTLARVGKLDYKIALELTRYLSKETDFIPLYAVWSHVRHLINSFADSNVSNYIKTYFLTSLQGIFTDLGLDDGDGEANIRKIGRSNVALWICNLGYQPCRTQAVSQFQNFIKNTKNISISPNIKDAVYCMGIKHGSEDDWKTLWNYYLESDLASEKNTVLLALGCSQDVNVLYNYLLKIIDRKSKIRIQDHYIVARSVLGEKVGIKAGLMFLDKHFSTLLQEAEKEERSCALDDLKLILSYIGAGISSKNELSELKRIVSVHEKNPLIANSINKTLTHIAESFEFKANHEKSVQEWFEQNTPTTPKPSPEPETTPHPHHNETSTTPNPNSANKISRTLLWALVLAIVLFMLL